MPHAALRKSRSSRAVRVSHRTVMSSSVNGLSPETEREFVDE
jgi:hypothetical protein